MCPLPISLNGNILHNVHNQHINMNTTPVSPILHVLVWVCAYVYIKSYAVLSRVLHHHQDPDQFHPHTGPSHFSFITICISFSPPLPLALTYPWPLIFLHFYNIAISRMSHKWNRIGCNPFFVAFYCLGLFHGVDVPQSNYHLLKGMRVIWNFWLL